MVDCYEFFEKPEGQSSRSLAHSLLFAANQRVVYTVDADIHRVRHVIPSVQGLPLPPPRTVRATFIAHGFPVRYS